MVIAGSSLHALPNVLPGVENAASSSGHWVAFARWYPGSIPSLGYTVSRLLGQGADGLVIIIADRPVVPRPGIGAICAGSSRKV